jgi:hypothetical protein
LVLEKGGIRGKLFFVNPIFKNGKILIRKNLLPVPAGGSIERMGEGAKTGVLGRETQRRVH